MSSRRSFRTHPAAGVEVRSEEGEKQSEDARPQAEHSQHEPVDDQPQHDKIPQQCSAMVTRIRGLT